MYRIVHSLIAIPSAPLLQPLGLQQEDTSTGTEHHTQGPQLTGNPFIHLGSACGTNCQRVSPAPNPWIPSNQGFPASNSEDTSQFLSSF